MAEDTADNMIVLVIIFKVQLPLQSVIKDRTFNYVINTYFLLNAPYLIDTPVESAFVMNTPVY